MQGDRLEQFIREHREEFDQSIPNLKIWAAIEGQLDQEQPPAALAGAGSAKRIMFWKGLRAVAAVLAFMVFGGLIGSYITRAHLQMEPAGLADISPDYAELKEYYETQIQDKYQQLVSYEQAAVVEPDLDQLDDIMTELRQELVNAPKGSQEQIVENLIQSYQTKIEILTRVLERIKTSNPKTLKSEDDEISI